MAAHSAVPVVNALTDEFHPCQILADLQTVRERLGRTAGLTLTYVGDGANNMAHSYLLGGATAGMHVRVAAPVGYQPDAVILDQAAAIAARTGGSVTLADGPGGGRTRGRTSSPPTPGCRWARTARRSGSRRSCPTRSTPSSWSTPRTDAIVLHCLPAYRGNEITAEVLDGPRSVVWDQAENRLHAQKALLALAGELRT